MFYRYGYRCGDEDKDEDRERDELEIKINSADPHDNPMKLIKLLPTFYR